MKLKTIKTSITFIVSLILIGLFASSINFKIEDERFVTYIVNPQKLNLGFYWKNENGEIFKNASNLKLWLKKQNRELIFAVNGGMYKKDNSPQGLYIENKIQLNKIDFGNSTGNFYLKPNGVFYLTTDKKAGICKSENFLSDKKTQYATQSGPMLVINGKIHSAFKENSTNLNIRNGVGILPNNDVIFAMSKKEINLYDFAAFFKNQGCKNALYLDGFVSRTYLPEKNWVQTDGDFGVIIGVTK